MDQVARPGSRATPGPPAQLDRLELRDKPEARDVRVTQVQPEDPATRESRVRQVQPVALVSRDSKVRQGHLDHQDSEARMVRLVLRD